MSDTAEHGEELDNLPIVNERAGAFHSPNSRTNHAEIDRLDESSQRHQFSTDISNESPGTDLDITNSQTSDVLSDHQTPATVTLPSEKRLQSTETANGANAEAPDTSKTEKHETSEPGILAEKTENIVASVAGVGSMEERKPLVVDTMVDRGDGELDRSTRSPVTGFATRAASDQSNHVDRAVTVPFNISASSVASEGAVNASSNTEPERCSSFDDGRGGQPLEAGYLVARTPNFDLVSDGKAGANDSRSERPPSTSPDTSSSPDRKSWVGSRGVNWTAGKWQASSSINERELELDEQFVQVPLQDSKAESISSRLSASPSLLERIGLGSYGQTRTLDSDGGSADNGTASGRSSGVVMADTARMRKDGVEELKTTSSSRTLEDFLGSPASQTSLNFSPKTASSFSFDGGSSFSSPLGSPLLQKGKALLPKVSPELMHLIDSAIHGSEPTSLQKLKRVVAGENFQSKEEGVTDSPSKVVEVLLAKMGGVEGQHNEDDTEAPRMMLSVGAALVAGELIPWLPSKENPQVDVDPRTKLVKGLATNLKACTRNRAMCSAAGLLHSLLAAARTIFTSTSHCDSVLSSSWNANPLLDILAVLGSHCLDVLDLRDWLSIIADAIPEGNALNLALTLERAFLGEETKGPSHTFEFDGESSGLLGPGESRWPFVNGYAFATWLYVESFADTVHTAAAAAVIAAAAAAKAGKSSAMSAAAAASALAGEGTAHMPRLFSFLSADNQGVEAYFHGQFLVVESAGVKGKKASLHFTYSFKPQRWYFIGLEHSNRQSILGKTESEVKLYVDGRLHESRPFEFPKVSKPLSFCCIGTNPPPAMAGLQRRRRQCPLFAEMGPVYIFKEPIGEDKMSRLAARGGDTVPAFGFGAGIPCLSTNELTMEAAQESTTLDTDLGPCLHLLYHPKLLAGRSCPDISPAGAAGAHRKPAEVLGHVHVAARVRPVEAIWALAEGGPLALLPLTVGAVDKDSMEPTTKDAAVSSQALVLASPILRIMSLSLQHPGNAEELLRRHAPQLLAQILLHLLSLPSLEDYSKIIKYPERPDARNEELVAAVVLLAHAPKKSDSLKVQLYRKLLLDLKLWSSCAYGLQKKLLSSLADMIFTESATMRAANAVQMLLDCCRKCYWIVPESDSMRIFAGDKQSRPVGELNALIDELLVIVELLLGTSHGSVASTDVQILVKFLVECPQPNQVARVLHLLYRLVVQPNTSRAAVFAENILNCGGIEMLLTLLRREYEAGETPMYMQYLEKCERGSNVENGCNYALSEEIETKDVQADISFGTEGSETNEDVHTDVVSDSEGIYGTVGPGPQKKKNSFKQEYLDYSNRMSSFLIGRNLGGIGLSITADSTKNKFRNVDDGDGIVIGIIGLVGALVTGGHLKLFNVSAISSSPSNLSLTPAAANVGDHIPGSNMNASVWLLYALQKVFQAAPRRLLTGSVYVALLAAVIRSEAGSLSSDVHLNLYDSVHSFEHTELLLVLFRALPYGSKNLQMRALQDILFLACTHSENRAILTAMPEWPEWILEILISKYEVGSLETQDSSESVGEIEDLVYNFLIIILEHSMRQKDGWKDVESTIHCAEWLAMVGGSSSGDHRQRREEALPFIKRKLLGGLLDFAARELQLQTQVVAAAAAGVAAEGLSPKTAKAEADAAAYMSMSLAENSLVLLMLVEDHLRLQCQIFNASLSSAPHGSGPASPRAFMPTPSLLGLHRTNSDGGDGLGSRRFIPSQDPGGLSLDILASMADSSGQISAMAMERLSAAAAAEPYESVRCAFVSYGSYGVDLADGWKRRSRLWYGVGLPAKATYFGGGGTGWESWMSALEKDENGDWMEMSLVQKSISMLQALLLDDAAGTSGNNVLGYGGGAGTGAGGMHALQQLLDSDQFFFTMLRVVLLAMREEDKGIDDSMPSMTRSRSNADRFSSNIIRMNSFSSTSGNVPVVYDKKTKAALLWCVLAPLLRIPLTESRRQRVLVSACIFYSEVWNSVSADRKIIRKQYVEMIGPPFTTLLRRWRPLLSGIHELTDADGQSPLAVEGRALATDAHPLEAALAMVTPEWAAAFASPSAAMALAMAAAGAGGGEVNTSKGAHQKHESSVFERKTTRLRSFASFHKAPESPGRPLQPNPKDKAGAKAAALAAARDQERAAKIGSGRGLGAVAMASSGQRRNISDRERAKRWAIFESMNTAWMDFSTALPDTGHDPQDKESSIVSLKLFLALSEVVETSRKLQQAEADRHMVLANADANALVVGTYAWRSLIRNLVEMEMLFGPIAWQLSNQRVYWKLDSLENSLRMRRRIKRNYKGTDHHGAAADSQEMHEHAAGPDGLSSSKVELDTSLNSNPLPPEAAQFFQEQPVFEDGVDDENLLSEGGDPEDQQEGKNFRLSVSSKQSSSDDHAIVEPAVLAAGTTSSSMPGAAQPPQFGVAESNERLLLEVPATMVHPLKLSKGVFQVTSRRIIFSLDYNVHVGDPDNEEAEGHASQKGGMGRAWSLSSLGEIYSRRYLLRRSALELFMVDRSNYFFNFGTSEGRKNAYKALVQARPPFLSNIYAGTQRPENLLKRRHLTERWQRWEISNFEYLMQLNTLAGRSYNDITQYPIFPWILSDYSSEILDLNNPNVYRDLSKPIGALNPIRLEKFLERYSNFDDPMIPRFHYGSHYSSAGTVLYYLLRVEPFTSLSIHLQGGKFDHADRLFNDIGSTWNGVLEDMSDLKELVPELFYLPEILMNVNGINFGKTQMGEKLDNVKLPPWATNPVDFIQKHREALESPYVSAHLHHWIDLIFGYKQRGKESIAANNVFFYMTYEGAVDIDKITDPAIRKATQDQIAYFGQTPSQLLSSPHPKRMALEDILHLQTIFKHPSTAQCYTVPFCERCNVPAGAICTTQESVITVDMNAPACCVAVHRWQPHTPDGHGMPFLFQHGKPTATTGGGALIRMFSRQTGSGSEWRYPRAVALTAPGIRSRNVVAITRDAHLLTGGHADNSMKLVAGDSARTLETAFGHCAPITCISLSPDGSTCMTGSRDCSAMLWRIQSNSTSSATSPGTILDPTLMTGVAAPASPVSSADNMDSNAIAESRRRRIDGPLHVLRGHVDELICCCINADLDIAVSCSRTQGVLLHSIIRGRLVCRLPLHSVDAVALSSDGILVIWEQVTRNLSTFTINGTAMGKIEIAASEGDITCIVVSTDGQHAVVGTSGMKLQESDSSWHVNQHHVGQQISVPMTKESDVCLNESSVPGLTEQNKALCAEATEKSERTGKTQPSPSIILYNLHTLQVMHMFKMQKGQHVTALALNRDSTNLVVSTADGQMFVHADPALSIQVVDRMLQLGWQGAGLTAATLKSTH